MLYTVKDFIKNGFACSPRHRCSHCEMSWLRDTDHTAFALNMLRADGGGEFFMPTCGDWRRNRERLVQIFKDLEIYEPQV